MAVHVCQERECQYNVDDRYSVKMDIYFNQWEFQEVNYLKG